MLYARHQINILNNNARMKKIKLAVTANERIKHDVFTHRFQLNILQITLSQLIQLINNSCMCGNYQGIKVSLFSVAHFKIMIFQ